MIESGTNETISSMNPARNSMFVTNKDEVKNSLYSQFNKVSGKAGSRLSWRIGSISLHAEKYISKGKISKKERSPNHPNQSPPILKENFHQTVKSPRNTHLLLDSWASGSNILNFENINSVSPSQLESSRNVLNKQSYTDGLKNYNKWMLDIQKVKNQKIINSKIGKADTPKKNIVKKEISKDCKRGNSKRKDQLSS